MWQGMLSGLDLRRPDPTRPDLTRSEPRVLFHLTGAYYAVKQVFFSLSKSCKNVHVIDTWCTYTANECFSKLLVIFVLFFQLLPHGLLLLLLFVFRSEGADAKGAGVSLGVAAGQSAVKVSLDRRTGW